MTVAAGYQEEQPDLRQQKCQVLHSLQKACMNPLIHHHTSFSLAQEEQPDSGQKKCQVLHSL